MARSRPGSVCPRRCAQSAPPTAPIPISLVLPCHRVIGADGSLTGYGGGLERKRWLLAHEQKNKAVSFRLSAVG